MENITIEEAVQKLKKENDFLKYLQLLKIVEPRYIIIIAVADTGAGPYYTKEHAAAMKDLGLEIDMSERYRTPYVAIINKGNVEMEFIPKQIDIPVVIRGKIGDHEVEVYSAGFEYHFGIGKGAYVKIDGANYMRSCRGFNYFVFDEENDDVVDTRGFDTFDMSGSTGKNHGRMKRIEPALKSFVDKFSKKKGGGANVQLCTLELPRPLGSRHIKDLTPYEQYLTQNKGLPPKIINQKEIAKDVYENKRFPYCEDFATFDEFIDIFYEPPCYITLDCTQKYIDYNGAAVHTQNGRRVTTDQPKNFKRSIYFIGPSRFFGYGVKDSDTFESVLQRYLNEESLENNFIVNNCGICGRESLRDISTLNSLPVKQGDIVFIFGRSIWGIPHCDLSLKSAHPHDYGNIFVDLAHFCKNGNRMIADGILEFLRKHDFFEETLKND